MRRNTGELTELLKHEQDRLEYELTVLREFNSATEVSISGVVYINLKPLHLIPL